MKHLDTFNGNQLLAVCAFHLRVRCRVRVRVRVRVRIRVRVRGSV